MKVTKTNNLIVYSIKIIKEVMKMQYNKSSLTGAVIIAIATLLLPVMIQAGSLEPSGAPAPTMKTLDQIPPTWSQKLQCDATACPRFEVLADFNNEAVLDKETGLVWEKTPDITNKSWTEATDSCYIIFTGDRFGWRPPKIEELSSLYGDGFSLPDGHPFINVQSSKYWSVTDSAQYSDYAFSAGLLGGPLGIRLKTIDYNVWCVRGGTGNDNHF